MSPAETKPAGSARDRILNTASRLFYQDGLRATGIDRIIAESGVAKMSFYRHFPSKADLIAEYLNSRHDQWMDWFTGEVDKRIGKPGSGLEVIADVLADWFSQPDFRGCAFINTLAESGTETGKERRIAIKHKNELQTYLEKLASKLAFERPGQVAEAAMIIIEGSIIRAQMTGNNDPLLYSRRLLKSLEQTDTR